MSAKFATLLRDEHGILSALFLGEEPREEGLKLSSTGLAGNMLNRILTGECPVALVSHITERVDLTELATAFERIVRAEFDIDNGVVAIEEIPTTISFFEKLTQLNMAG